MTDLVEAFARQRRSLMAISLLLLAYTSAGISLDKISVLGNSFSVSRPSLIPVALWVAWIYFGLRYYQLYRDLADLEPREAHGRYLDKIVIRRARREAPPNLGTAFIEGADSSGIKWSFDDESVDSRGPTLWGVALSATATSRGGVTRRMSNYRVMVEAPNRFNRARAWLEVAVHTRHFTEYGLPAIVAATPVIAWIIVTIMHH